MALISTIALAYQQSSGVRTFVTTFVLSKPTSDSALERLITTLNAWDYFQQYPILGLGWGSVPSDDLVVFLLANTGVIGLVAFLALIVAVLRRVGGALRAGRAGAAPEWLTFRAAGAGVAFTTVVFLSASARFTYEYAHFWVALGLAIGASVATLIASQSSPAVSVDPRA